MPRLTHAALRAAIEDVREDYLAQGLSLHGIGNGYCETFAEDVLDRALGPGWHGDEGCHDWGLLWSDQLFATSSAGGAPRWDWDLLKRRWRIDVDPAQRPVHDLVAAREPAHCWIHLGCRPRSA